MIEIKDIQGNQLLSVPITQACQKVEELMAADYVQLSWESDSSDVIPVGSYIDIDGERYRLLEPYSPTQKDELVYVYTPKFESRVRAWGKMPFFFYSETSKEPDWTLTSNPADFMRCVCDSIRNESGESWTYSVDASLPASASLSFSSSDILSVLNQIASAFETEWFADKETNTIYLGRLSHGEEAVLEVGKNIGVPSVQANKDGYYTRFYAFGSTRNITQDYNGANTNNLVNKRLTLDPVKYPNGYKDIRSGLSEGEIFSKVLIFDDVYPSAKLSISGVRSRLMYRLDESGDKVQLGTDESGNPIYDQYTIWYFRIEGFTFDWENVIDGLTPSISFQSGALNGREFEIIYYNEDKKITTSDGIVFEAKKGDYEIKFIEENNIIIPSMTGLVPSDGDEVVLFNIKMPSEYTQSAYDELEVELDKEIAKLTSDLNNYSFKSNPVAFNESNPQLSIGRAVRYVNGDYSYSTRVIKLTTQLDFPIEQSITIGNEKVKGNTQQLKEEVASANKDLNLLAVFNDMTQTIQQSYNRTQQMMLDGFAAIKNIWQLKETPSGEKYAWSAFNVVTQLGLTTFTDGSQLDLPQIYDGLPIDNQTLYWEETDGVKVLKAKGGGSGEGGGVLSDITFIGNGNALTNAELSDDGSSIVFTKELTFVEKTYVDNNFYNKTYSDNNFAKASELSSLQTSFNDFLNGEDVDTTINKWKELESFLSNMTESDNLATILSNKAEKTALESLSNVVETKWTKDDTKILNWDTAFGWGDHSKAGYALKTYVDETFIGIKGDYTIEGIKNFVGELQVNGCPIVYDAQKKYWKLEGDLLVTGGLSTFSSDLEFDPSTIMDGINCDGVTIHVNEYGQLEVIGGGGEVDEDAVKEIIESYSFATSAELPKFDTNDFSVSAGMVSLKGASVKIVSSSDSMSETDVLYVIV